MPKIYLSPSTQEGNKYLDGKSEEYYMNLLADMLTPYLYSNGISFKRNRKDMTAKDNIIDSNKENYDFHLALHSNASPEGKEGKKQGIEIYYYPKSQKGEKMALILKEKLSEIYPYKDKVSIIPTTSLGEVDLTKAPSVLIEAGYHDNLEDERWIKENLALIAKKIGEALADYFSIPFAEPIEPFPAFISTMGGSLNLRNLPDLNSKVFLSMPHGKEVTVFGIKDNWARVVYKGILGFCSDRFLNYN